MKKNDIIKQVGNEPNEKIKQAMLCAAAVILDCDNTVDDPLPKDVLSEDDILQIYNDFKNSPDTDEWEELLLKLVQEVFDKRNEENINVIPDFCKALKERMNQNS